MLASHLHASVLPAPMTSCSPLIFFPSQIFFTTLSHPRFLTFQSITLLPTFISLYHGWISYSSWEEEQHITVAVSEAAKRRKAATFAVANECPPGTLLYSQSPRKRAAKERAIANGSPPGTFPVYASGRAAKAAAAPESVE
jgi:hypothetical protein